MRNWHRGRVACEWDSSDSYIPLVPGEGRALRLWRGGRIRPFSYDLRPWCIALRCGRRRERAPGGGPAPVCRDQVVSYRAGARWSFVASHLRRLLFGFRWLRADRRCPASRWRSAMCCWAISSSCSGCIVSSFVVSDTSKVRIRRGPPHRAPSLDPAVGGSFPRDSSRPHLSRA